MVLIVYKKTENNQFMYETAANTPVEVVIKELVEINNSRIVLDRLAVCIEDLATHGPMRPDDTRGLSQDDLIDAAIECMNKDHLPWARTPKQAPQGYRLNPDKQSYRTGVILPEDMTNMMIKHSNDTKQAISHHLVEQKRCLSVKIVRELIDTLRGVMMISYPGFNGLPPWEPTKIILENQYDPESSASDAFDYYPPDKAQLWWAGKELLPGKILSDYSGKNEKTKIIVRMQRQGSGAPVREPAVDAETQKKMMSYYYKKQEEQKQLEQDNDDSHLGAAWANPKNLKNSLTGGIRDISYKGK